MFQITRRIDEEGWYEVQVQGFFRRTSKIGGQAYAFAKVMSDEEYHNYIKNSDTQHMRPFDPKEPMSGAFAKSKLPEYKQFRSTVEHNYKNFIGLSGLNQPYKGTGKVENEVQPEDCMLTAAGMFFVYASQEEYGKSLVRLMVKLKKGEHIVMGVYGEGLTGDDWVAFDNFSIKYTGPDANPDQLLPFILDEEEHAKDYKFDKDISEAEKKVFKGAYTYLYYLKQSAKDFEKKYNPRMIYLHRTFKQNQWSSSILPIDIYRDELRQQFGENCKVAYPEGLSLDGTHIEFRLIDIEDGRYEKEPVMKAYRPYVMYISDEEGLGKHNKEGYDNVGKDISGEEVKVKTPYYIFQNKKLAQQPEKLLDRKMEKVKPYPPFNNKLDEDDYFNRWYRFTPFTTTDPQLYERIGHMEVKPQWAYLGVRLLEEQKGMTFVFNKGVLKYVSKEHREQLGKTKVPKMRAFRFVLNWRKGKGCGKQKLSPIVKFLPFSKMDIPTAIEEVEHSAAVQPEIEGIFDLYGRRLDEERLQAGQLVIINGKKVRVSE